MRYSQHGDLSDDCKAAGKHYNPHKQKHGDLDSKVRHEGDLGNIIAESNNRSTVDLTARNVSLSNLLNR